MSFSSTPPPSPKIDSAMDTRRRDLIKLVRGISLAIVVVGLMVVFFHSSPKVERMVTNGRIVPAKVERRYLYDDGTGAVDYVDYAYQMDGQTYTGRKRLTKSERSTLFRGAPIMITVSPDAPEKHELGILGVRHIHEARRNGSLLVFLLALPFALAAHCLKHQFRWERNRTKDWPTLTAQVVEIDKETIEGDDYYSITYRITLPNGESVTKQRDLSEEEAGGMQVGEFFPILVPPSEVPLREKAGILPSSQHGQKEPEAVPEERLRTSG